MVLDCFFQIEGHFCEPLLAKRQKPLEKLEILLVALIVVEATGGYETPLVVQLAEAGLPVVLMNPRQVRSYATAVGELAKTDAIDARILARFGAIRALAMRGSSCLNHCGTKGNSSNLAASNRDNDNSTSENNNRATVASSLFLRGWILGFWDAEFVLNGRPRLPILLAV